MNLKHILILSSCILTTACGGGSPNSQDSPTIPEVTYIAGSPVVSSPSPTATQKTTQPVDCVTNPATCK